MFVVIYTHGPAWQTGKTVTEQPFFREHIRYMQQLFAARQLLMGGPFLDSVGALAILDLASVAQTREIVAHDPFVLARVIEPHCIPGMPTSISIKLAALKRGKLTRKSQSGEKLGGGQRKSDRPRMQKKIETE